MLTITKQHLVAAASVPWETSSCLVAQAVISRFGPVQYVGYDQFSLKGGGTISIPEVKSLVERFDQCWDYADQEYDQEGLHRVSDMLPMTFGYTWLRRPSRFARFLTWLQRLGSPTDASAS